jgi:hypothetical protein
MGRWMTSKAGKGLVAPSQKHIGEGRPVRLKDAMIVAVENDFLLVGAVPRTLLRGKGCGTRKG